MADNRKRKMAVPQFLSGWKEIANYLGKGVRTIQRYEKEFGLPVRRPAGRVKGAVVATKAELDVWVAASPIREAYRILPRVPNTGVNPLSEIKTSMLQMHRLRDQMFELRGALTSSIAVLHASLRELNREVGIKLEREAVSPLLQEWDSERRHALAAVTSMQRGRKAS